MDNSISEFFFKPRKATRPGMLVVLHAITTLLGLPLMLGVYVLTLTSFWVLGLPYINFTTSLFMFQAIAIILSGVILVFIIAKFTPFGISLVISIAGGLCYFIAMFDRGTTLGFTSVFTIDCMWRKANLTLIEFFICTQDGVHPTFTPAYALIIWLISIFLAFQAILGFLTMFLDVLWVIISSRKTTSRGLSLD